MLSKNDLVNAAIKFRRAIGEQPILVGSGAMVMCGFTKHANDIDVIASARAIAHIRKMYPINVKWDAKKNAPSEYFTFHLSPEDSCEFDTGPSTLGVNAAAEVSETSGVKHLNVVGLLRFYEMLNRDKDQEKIAFLRKVVSHGHR